MVVHPSPPSSSHTPGSSFSHSKWIPVSRSGLRRDATGDHITTTVSSVQANADNLQSSCHLRTDSLHMCHVLPGVYHEYAIDYLIPHRIDSMTTLTTS